MEIKKNWNLKKIKKPRKNSYFVNDYQIRQILKWQLKTYFTNNELKNNYFIEFS